MTALAGFVIAYLVVSVAIGLVAARRVHNATDYALAGRRLPLAITVATVFATWFGAETVLGISAVFLKENLRGVASDPFGASLCLVIVGLFFAARWYRLNLLTIGDYFRERYNRVVEVSVSLAIVAGYLGWTSAQVIALGLVFNVISQGAIPHAEGMAIGAAIVLAYTLFGGMWSVALTDFFQMIIIVLGMLYIGWVASDLAGGAGTIVAHAAAAGKFELLPRAEARDVLWFIGAVVTMMLGSIPQQDTYQRVMAARDERTAVRGSIIGGALYFLFALIPMFLAYAAALADPRMVAGLIDADPQMILPRLVLDHMPVAAQVMFFGALLAAIMSSASGALLAPAVAFTENVLKPLFARRMSDDQQLRTTRVVLACFTLVVLIFCFSSEGSIYKTVEHSYKITLVCGFVPLVAGLFWRRATAQGAIAGFVLGAGSWIALEIASPDGLWPPQLAGLLLNAAGMIAGSLAPPARIARP